MLIALLTVIEGRGAAPLRLIPNFPFPSGACRRLHTGIMCLALKDIIRYFCPFRVWRITQNVPWKAVQDFAEFI